jgi:hypothetical protein
VLLSGDRSPCRWVMVPSFLLRPAFGGCNMRWRSGATLGDCTTVRPLLTRGRKA